MFYLFFFFFNDTATTEIYTLSLHDALPICGRRRRRHGGWPGLPADDPGHASRRGVALGCRVRRPGRRGAVRHLRGGARSEEHTSELQSRQYLVCRLLLEKKKNNTSKHQLNV